MQNLVLKFYADFDNFKVMDRTLTRVLKLPLSNTGYKIKLLRLGIDISLNVLVYFNIYHNRWTRNMRIFRMIFKKQ
jgi:hypothetical protein